MDLGDQYSTTDQREIHLFPYFTYQLFSITEISGFSKIAFLTKPSYLLLLIYCLFLRLGASAKQESLVWDYVKLILLYILFQ